MNNYRYDSIVSNQEAEALKEMIFKRARERAEAMNTEAQESVSNSVKNEVMDLARYSFISAKKNPFNSITESEPVVQKEHEDEKAVKAREIEVHRQHIEAIKANITVKQKNIGETVARTAVEATMQEARSGVENKSTFMGALNFLNSQATISLIKSKGASFEAVV